MTDTPDPARDILAAFVIWRIRVGDLPPAVAKAAADLTAEYPRSLWQEIVDFDGRTYIDPR